MAEEASQKRGGNFLSTLKRADVFGQDFTFLMNNKKSKLQSVLGVFFGLLVVVLLIAYGTIKL